VPVPKKTEKKVVILRSNYKENKNSTGDVMPPGLEHKELAILFPPSNQEENMNNSLKDDNKSSISKKSAKNTSKLGFGSSTRK